MRFQGPALSLASIGDPSRPACIRTAEHRSQYQLGSRIEEPNPRSKKRGKLVAAGRHPELLRLQSRHGNPPQIRLRPAFENGRLPCGHVQRHVAGEVDFGPPTSPQPIEDRPRQQWPPQPVVPARAIMMGHHHIPVPGGPRSGKERQVSGDRESSKLLGAGPRSEWLAASLSPAGFAALPHLRSSAPRLRLNIPGMGQSAGWTRTSQVMGVAVPDDSCRRTRKECRCKGGSGIHERRGNRGGNRFFGPGPSPIAIGVKNCPSSREDAGQHHRSARRRKTECWGRRWGAGNWLLPPRRLSGPHDQSAQWRPGYGCAGRTASR